MLIAASAVFSAAVMLLWNAIMPELFGLPFLDYWQAAGVFFLTRILFGGIGGGRFLPGIIRRDGWAGHHGNLLREKWMNMSEEERKAFIEKEKSFHHFFHDRFSSRLHGFYTDDDESKKTVKEDRKD
jgi:Fe-S cluster biosynthesis and repair protein YggX